MKIGSRIVQVEVGDDVAHQQDEHVFMGMRQCLLAGAKEGEDRIQENDGHNTHQETCDDVQGHHIAQDVVRLVILALSQA